MRPVISMHPRCPRLLDGLIVCIRVDPKHAVQLRRERTPVGDSVPLPGAHLCGFMRQQKSLLACLQCSSAQDPICQIDGVEENSLKLTVCIEHRLANELEVSLHHYAGFALQQR